MPGREAPRTTSLRRRATGTSAACARCRVGRLYHFGPENQQLSPAPGSHSTRTSQHALLPRFAKGCSSTALNGLTSWSLVCCAVYYEQMPIRQANVDNKQQVI